MPYAMPRRYAGDDQFTGLLTEVKCPMPVCEVRAFVLGCLAATEVPKVDAILSSLWGGEVPAFESMEHLERFTGHFFALWNDLAAQTSNLDFPLSPAPDVGNLSDVQRWVVRRQAEVTAFLRGLDAGKTNPEKLSADVQEALKGLGTVMHLWSEFDRLVGEEQPTAEVEPETVPNLRHLDQVAGTAVRFVIIEQQRARVQRTRGGGAAHVRSAEPGRNGPCPCGSGRKYKRCCGKH